MLQIIGVFPHVAKQQGNQGQRGVLVGGLDHGEPPLAVADQPGPARPELAQGGVLHGGLQPVQAPEVPGHGVGQGSGGGGHGTRGQGLKIEVVVVNAPGVVPHALADVLRQAGPFLDQALQGPVLDLRVRFQELVQVVDIRCEVLVVVEVQRPLPDLRQQGVIAVGQGREGEGVM